MFLSTLYHIFLPIFTWFSPFLHLFSTFYTFFLIFTHLSPIFTFSPFFSFFTLFLPYFTLFSSLLHIFSPFFNWIYICIWTGACFFSTLLQHHPLFSYKNTHLPPSSLVQLFATKKYYPHLSSHAVGNCFTKKSF